MRRILRFFTFHFPKNAKECLCSFYAFTLCGCIGRLMDNGNAFSCLILLNCRPN